MGFFKKLIDQVKKEYPDVGEFIDSAREGKMKQYFQDQVAEITGFGTPSTQQSYGEYLEQEKRERIERIDARKEALKTVYRAPADIEMAAETRRQINERIKGNLNPRNFMWGSKAVLEEAGDYFVDNSDKEEDELCSYLESRGIRYDRQAMEIELGHFRSKSVLALYRRSQIEEFIFLDRMTSDEILELLDDDIREMEERRNSF